MYDSSVRTDSASSAAYCDGSGAQATMFSVILVIAPISSRGPSAQPTRQPVIA